MPEYDHEYTVVVRPNARLRFALDTDRGGVDALVAALEYRQEGDWEVVARPDRGDDEGRADVSWRGYAIDVFRDGERASTGPIPGVGLGDVLAASLEAVEPLWRRAMGELRRIRSGPSSRTTMREGAPLSVPQPDGTRVEVNVEGVRAAFEVYEDASGDWRWRLRHDEGGVVAVSGRSYGSKSAAEEGVLRVKQNAAAAPVES